MLKLKYLKHPKLILVKLLTKNIIPVSDDRFIRLVFKLKLNRNINLSNPQSLNEKCQWIKLYDRNPLYSKLVDKYEVKNIVEKKIGENYIIPTIGIYNTFDEIDFDKLPNKFVIKCTHDSGGLVVCTDKNKLNLKKARNKISKSLRKNYYYDWREWPYKNVKPRIIIERYMGENLMDFKIQCFNGKVDNILVCAERASSSGVKYYYFNKNWEFLNYSINTNEEEAKKITKPDNLDEMLDVAKKLSEGLPEVRVDLYNVQNHIYFGEMTFFSEAGFDTTITTVADYEMGKHFILPKKKEDKYEN